MEDLALMRKHSLANLQVKAAGGVRDLDTLLKIRDLGVTRCGASRTQEILDEANRRLGRPAVHTAHVLGGVGY
jgi:deoxyribose-phosphate aldolase